MNKRCATSNGCCLKTAGVICQLALITGTICVATSERARASAESSDPSAASFDQLQEISVTAGRLSLMGTASTASQGIVANDEIALMPAFRPGQLLETVPGLQVTSHSGEGKANQYLLRGYNLDHGTDLATFVDGMPINEPTHAHGQGYTDLNFLIPELVTNISFTKGPYYADEGDFASVGSIRMSYLTHIDDQLAATAGTLGFQRYLAAGSTQAGEGSLLGALETQHYDGPWVDADDQHKINAVLRYSEGVDTDGFSITGMYYHSVWNATTDQPERAIVQGLISRFGSLDSSDGGDAQRSSVSAQYFKTIGDGQVIANVYMIGERLTLWNDFTHFLIDPIHGDQEAQHESRTTVGGAASYARAAPLLGLDNQVSTGLVSRVDYNEVSRLPSKERVVIPLDEAPLNPSESDRVRLTSLAAYGQDTTHWTDWFRSVFGIRYDRIYGDDSGTNAGTASSGLMQPKGSLIFRLAQSTELYLSAGRGFHSDDLRGVTSAEARGRSGAPLIASQTGEEVGVRLQFAPSFTATFAVYSLSAHSETTYDPDVGLDFAGPGSCRRGFEINLTYQAFRWLEFYGSYSADQARFTTSYNDGTGHLGEYLPNAPFATGSFNVYVKDLGPWSGGLEYRYLGAYPLSSDNQVEGHGYGEWNADAHYLVGEGWSVSVSLYNLLNKQADAAQFWYVDRLPGEPPSGVADVHIHPLEPRSARLTIAKHF